MVKCAAEDCDNVFASGNNKRYCSQPCSIKANNKKAMQRYNDRKSRLAGGHRACATIGCGTILRKENSHEYCESCLSQKEQAYRDALRRLTLEVIGIKE